MNIVREELKSLMLQTRLLIEQEYALADAIHIEPQNKVFFESIAPSSLKKSEPKISPKFSKPFTPAPQPHTTPPKQIPTPAAKIKEPQAAPKPTAEVKPITKNVKNFELHPLPSPPLFNVDPWINLYQQLFPQQIIEKNIPDKILIPSPKFLFVASGNSELQNFMENISKTLQLYQASSMMVSLAKLSQMNLSASPQVILIEQEIFEQASEIFNKYPSSTIIKLQAFDIYREPSQKKTLWNLIKPFL